MSFISCKRLSKRGRNAKRQMPLYPNSRLLSDFREVPYEETFSRARQTRGRPAPAAAICADVIGQIQKQYSKRAAADIILENWGQCMQSLKDKCALQSVNNGVVFIATFDAHARQAIAFNQRKILERITSLEGCRDIKRIRFV